MATSGQSQLEVILNYREDLSGKAPKTIKSLTGIDKAALSTAKSVDALNKVLGRGAKTSGLDAYGRSLGKLLSEMKATKDEAGRMASSFGRDISTKGIDAAIKKTRELKKAEQELSRPLPSPATRPPARLTTPQRPYRPGDWRRDSDKPYDWHRDVDQPTQPTQPTPKGEDEAQPGRTRRRSESRLDATVERLQQANELLDAPGKLQDIWSERLHGLEAYTEETKALAMAQQKFIALNLPLEDNVKAFEAARQASKSISGLTFTEATETLTDLHTALGNLEHATEALPIAGKYRVGVSTMLGDKFSSGQIEEQIQSGFRFLEMINAVSDKGKMEAYFNRLQQITAATGGRVTPQEMLQMAQTGGTAVQNLSLEGLTALTLPMIEMGGSRVGTADQTLFQNIVAGRMDKSAIPEWERLGLLDESKVTRKKGKITGAAAGAVTIGPQMLDSTLKFADSLRDAMKAHGVKTEDPQAVMEELAKLKMPRTASELLSLLINQRPRVEKDMGIVTGAKDIEALYGQGANTPLGAIFAAEAAVANAKAQIGMPILQAQGSASANVVKPSADYISQHPTLAAWLGYGKMGFEGLSGLASSGLVIALLAKAFFGGGAGAAGAGAAATAGGEAAAGAAGAGGAAAGGGGLGALLLGLSGPAAIAALAGGSLFAVHSNYKYETEKRQQAEGDAGAHFDEIKRLREQNGGHLPDELSRKYATEAFPGIDRRGLLNELDLKTYGTPGYPGISAGPQVNHDEVMAGAFQRRAPELQFPELMRAFIDDTRAKVKSGNLSEALGGYELKIAEKAFPEAFKQASQASAEELAKLAPAASSTTDALTKLQDPAAKLALGLTGAQDAAIDFAARVNALNLTPPAAGTPASGSSPLGPHGGGASSTPRPSRLWPQTPFGGYKARGGPVKRGLSYIVGEEGEEAFTPDSDGYITPHHKLAEGLAGSPDFTAFAVGGAPHINVQIGDINVQGGDAKETGAAVAAEVERQVREVLARLARVEGDLYDPHHIDGMVTSARERTAQRS